MKKTYLPAEKKFLRKIGDNIRAVRKMKNISQEDLAFRSDLERAYFGGVERGERNISILNLNKIADALKVDIIKLFRNNI